MTVSELEPMKGAFFDDRSLFEVAKAVVETTAAYSSFPSEDAVWNAYINWKGGADREYIQTIRRTRHSMFFYQLQYLYEFGKEVVESQFRDRFCFEAGRRFADILVKGNIYNVLQLALFSSQPFQDIVVDMIGSYIARYAGEKYLVSCEKTREEVVVSIKNLNQERIKSYFDEHGLEAGKCFQNSTHFIAGSIVAFMSLIVADFSVRRFSEEVTEADAVYRMPIREDDHFAYDWLIKNLIGYVTELEARRDVLAKDERLESDLIIHSAVMRRTWERIYRAARTNELVLLQGESGTGKSFLARKIHDLSPRSKGPFVEVGLTSDIGTDNMIQSNLFGHEKGAFTGATAQKSGLFSLADGGTILLDEIGDASPDLQAKLLRVIEKSTFKRLGGVDDIKVDVRIVTATNRDLEQMVKDGSFRQDLFYRLNVITVELPPLRERADDIPALATFLLNRSTGNLRGIAKRLGDGVAERLTAYPWPGNIRELDHALRHAVAMSDGEVISLADFPESITGSTVTHRNAPEKSATPVLDTAIINESALREVIRGTNPLTAGASHEPYCIPAHVEYARKVYMTALIHELGGDLGLIRHFWDRGSEKTLRTLIKSYGLSEVLKNARKKSQGKSQTDSC